eukprot:Hpha_TRINITY_DN16354_c4_g8::TRINITY_DN16354_c4_g8_i1::g.60370::m.60370
MLRHQRLEQPLVRIYLQLQPVRQGRHQSVLDNVRLRAGHEVLPHASEDREVLFHERNAALEGLAELVCVLPHLPRRALCVEMGLKLSGLFRAPFHQFTLVCHEVVHVTLVLLAPPLFLVQLPVPPLEGIPGGAEALVRSVQRHLQVLVPRGILAHWHHKLFEALQFRLHLGDALSEALSLAAELVERRVVPHFGVVACRPVALQRLEPCLGSRHLDKDVPSPREEVYVPAPRVSGSCELLSGVLHLLLRHQMLRLRSVRQLLVPLRHQLRGLVLRVLRPLLKHRDFLGAASALLLQVLIPLLRLFPRLLTLPRPCFQRGELRGNLALGPHERVLQRSRLLHPLIHPFGFFPRRFAPMYGVCEELNLLLDRLRGGDAPFPNSGVVTVRHCPTRKNHTDSNNIEFNKVQKL